jgi:hypothetical protein
MQRYRRLDWLSFDQKSYDERKIVDVQRRGYNKNGHGGVDERPIELMNKMVGFLAQIQQV